MSARAWLLASRPATLTAAVAPVAVGTSVAFAEGELRWPAALAALFGAMAIQIGTNFANDVFDYEKGADTEERLGPTRAVAAGLLSPGAVRLGMIVAFLFATLCGVYLTWISGPVIVAIGVLSIASGILYTAGPYPLAYVGLGDVFVILFFGFVAVLGTSYVQTDAVTVRGVLASIPVGALATAILAVNNLRDRHQDVHADKRTLAVRFGGGFARAEWLVLILASYATPVVMWGLALASPWILLPLVTIPLALKQWLVVRREEGVVLNGALAGTAKLLLVFSVLFAVGIAV